MELKAKYTAQSSLLHTLDIPKNYHNSTLHLVAWFKKNFRQWNVPYILVNAAKFTRTVELK